MKIVIEIPESEIDEAHDLLTCLSDNSPADKTVQLTFGSFIQTEIEYKSVSIEHSPPRKKNKIRSSK